MLRLQRGTPARAASAAPRGAAPSLPRLACQNEKTKRWEYGPLLEAGAIRLGTLAFVPGVVYRASAPDEEGTAGERDIGRAAGGPRRAACMHEPDRHAQKRVFDKFWRCVVG